MNDAEKRAAKDEERAEILALLAGIADNDDELDGITAEEAVRFVAHIIRGRKGQP